MINSLSCKNFDQRSYNWNFEANHTTSISSWEIRMLPNIRGFQLISDICRLNVNKSQLIQAKFPKTCLPQNYQMPVLGAIFSFYGDAHAFPLFKEKLTNQSPIKFLSVSKSFSVEMILVNLKFSKKS